MSIKPLKVKRNDGQPYYATQAEDANGVIDLSGATILCTMREKLTDGTLSPTKKIDRQSAGIFIEPDQVTNKGWFHYAWQTDETDTAAQYSIEFEITPAVGKKFTLPAADEDEALVTVFADLDET
jgi:hypothetical protein